MAVVAVFEGPTLTQESYSAVTRKLAGKDQMESVADWPVEGLLVHVAGHGNNGFRVVDVWESEEAFARFGEVLMPILQELGIDVQPQVYPPYALVTA